jgi:hypothetical protein
MPVAQDLDVSVSNDLSQLALGHPVMPGDLLQGQRRVALTGEDEAGGETGIGWGGSHFASLLLTKDVVPGEHSLNFYAASRPVMPTLVNFFGTCLAQNFTRG